MGTAAEWLGEYFNQVSRQQATIKAQHRRLARLRRTVRERPPERTFADGMTADELVDYVAEPVPPLPLPSGLHIRWDEMARQWVTVGDGRHWLTYTDDTFAYWDQTA